MAQSGFSLKISIDILEKGAVKKAARVEKSIDKIGKTAKRVSTQSTQGFKALAGAFTGLVVARYAAGFIGAMISPAMRLEEATANLAAATGAAGTALQELQTAALDAAAATTFSPTEAIEGMRILRLAVTDTDSAVRAIKPTMQMAQTFFAGKVAPAAQLAGHIVKGFGISAEEVEGKLDKLVAISRLAGVQVSELAGAFDLAGITSQVASSNFEDVTALMALSVSAGLPARRTITGLFNAFSKFSTSKTRGELAKLGVEVLDENGKFRKMRDVVIDLAAGMKKYGIEQASNVVTSAIGVRASKALLAVTMKLNKGITVAGQSGLTMRDAFAAIDDQLEKSTGLLGRMSEIAMAPLSQQIKLATQSIDRLISNAFLPLVKAVALPVSLLATVVNYFSKLREEGGFLATVVFKLGGAFAAFGALVVGLAAFQMVLFGAIMLINAGMGATGVQLVIGIGGFKKLGIAVWGSVRSLFAFRTAEKLAGSGAVVAAAKVGILKSAFRGLRTAILGPLGLILIMAEVFFDILGIRGKLFGAADGGAMKRADALRNQANMLTYAGERAQKIISGMSEASKQISDAFRKIAEEVYKGIPELPKQLSQKLLSAFEKTKGSLSPEGRTRSIAMLGKYESALNEMATTGVATASTIDAIRAALLGFSGQISRDMPAATRKGFLKMMNEADKAFERAKTSPAMGAALAGNITHQQEVAAKIRKLIVGEQERLAKLDVQALKKREEYAFTEEAIFQLSKATNVWGGIPGGWGGLAEIGDQLQEVNIKIQATAGFIGDMGQRIETIKTVGAAFNQMIDDIIARKKTMDDLRRAGFGAEYLGDEAKGDTVTALGSELSSLTARIGNLVGQFSGEGLEIKIVMPDGTVQKGRMTSGGGTSSAPSESVKPSGSIVDVLFPDTRA